MYSAFEEFNLFAYWALVNGVLDVVLWCLGPYVDESRDYGWFRRQLADFTSRLVRIWLLYRDYRQRPV
jgi:hypothetical protein